MAENAIAVLDRNAHLSIDTEECLFAVGLHAKLDRELSP